MKFKYYFLFLCSTFLLFLSCSADSEISEESHNSFKVDLTEIKILSQKIVFPERDKFTKDHLSQKVSSQSKKIKNIEEVIDDNGETSFYAINYEGGGFILLAADKRISPVLGFSEKNNFVVDNPNYPPGLRFWVAETKKNIASVRGGNTKPTEKEEIAWETDEIQNMVFPVEPPDEECPDEMYIEGPLLKSSWDQMGGFNDSLPYITCNGNQFQVYAGCVPIAMAQVMFFYNYPTNYTWSNMPLNYATSTTADFIEDIHDAIRNVYGPNQPFYNCTSTGVSSSLNMGQVFKTEFSYTSADWANYDSDIVVANINWGRPVILSGDNGSTGHMWVSDGYRKSFLHSSDCQMTYGYLHLHMNWGWGGSYDGYYSFNNFNPGSTHYNNNRKMIYNIKP